MRVTISTHNGSKIARDHNIRNRNVTDKEEHINPNGFYEVWQDMDIREAYQNLFGDSVKEYNEKQKRKDRKITNYYEHIKGSKQKHTAYELIAGVYNKELSDKAKYDILEHYADTFEDRNPNLYVFGCYYHADEKGEPHIHLDYIPFSESYKNGMSKRSGLTKALEDMGYSKKGRDTAQIQWQRQENYALERICREYDLTVEHPERRGRKKHLDTMTYKRNCLQEEITRLTEQKNTYLLENIGIEVLEGELEREQKEHEETKDILQSMRDWQTKTEVYRDDYGWGKVSAMYDNDRMLECVAEKTDKEADQEEPDQVQPSWEDIDMDFDL